MIYGIYAVRDNLVGFLPNFVLEVNEQTARRNFTISCKNIDDVAIKDYSLYHIGNYDTESGEIKPVSPVEFVMHGVKSDEV